MPVLPQYQSQVGVQNQFLSPSAQQRVSDPFWTGQQAPQMPQWQTPGYGGGYNYGTPGGRPPLGTGQGPQGHAMPNFPPQAPSPPQNHIMGGPGGRVGPNNFGQNVQQYMGAMQPGQSMQNGMVGGSYMQPPPYQQPSYGGNPMLSPGLSGPNFNQGPNPGLMRQSTGYSAPAPQMPGMGQRIGGGYIGSSPSPYAGMFPGGRLPPQMIGPPPNPGLFNRPAGGAGRF